MIVPSCLPVKRSHSRSITPKAKASTQPQAPSLFQACRSTPHCWSTTCHRLRPPPADPRAGPRPSLRPGTGRGNERESDARTAKERKVMWERGVRVNWYSSQTDHWLGGGGGREGGDKEEKSASDVAPGLNAIRTQILDKTATHAPFYITTNSP